MWILEKVTGFESRFKKFSKKHEIEVSAALSNLQTYVDVLNKTNNLQTANQQLFVHSEQDEMVAIDQRGAKIERKTGKLKATRLYVYAAVINQTVYLLGIGDKDSQKQDLQTFSKKMKKIIRGLSDD
ncbi:MAG: hypothetical protein PF904_16770 [Kiritimatiellae bacterium]|jgi:hypothetical protein|nr:hypothetical protein [Kiritimatiellia bacterium]